MSSKKRPLLEISPDSDADEVATAGDLVISTIKYDGEVKRTESDEYVEITSISKTVVDISDCVLKDINASGKVGATFKFPESSTLKPGKSVRVYTNEDHEGHYSFNSGMAIWNNTAGKAVLESAGGEVIDEYTYPKKATAGDLVISTIKYDGEVKRTESDEYVEITSISKTVVDISDCVLKDINASGKVGATFKFPESSTLKPGKSVRVYTNEDHEGHYSFNSGMAIWNNTAGKAVLESASGEVIEEYTYP